MPVKSTGKGKFRIPNVPGTGTKAQKQRQLKAIKVNQGRKKSRRKR